MTSAGLPAAASAQSIDAALRRAGLLHGARIDQVSIEASYPTVLSHIFRLRLTYSGSMPEGAPPSLILKAGLAEREGGPWMGGQREVAFYETVAPKMADVTPRCYDAQWQAESGTWHLLLEDLTDSHAIATRWPLPPTSLQCEAIIRARARLHARWWNDPRLGTTVGTIQDAEVVARSIEALRKLFPAFADQMGDSLSAERRDLYERLMDAAPRLLSRFHADRNLTIVHGDAHFWNCFIPKAGPGDDVRFFDWDAWRIGIGSDDLAYMLAVHWYPDLRRARECHLLDCYHAELIGQGVSGYDRADLQDDYRLSVLWQTTKPVWQHGASIPPLIWWNNFERIHLAAQDLDCRELLE